ncbi:hypothetical protein [Humibacter sp.]|jgi:hypothetical protein|uniref:hypothetical protein n=1 Tax=Humibacter sp. TaxID=1940291 RepID=UPI002C5C391B|nr:hypothetical protein [Humibacter sp.]HVX06464.1 hypothetical protein [Humibacter sp.]
MSDPNAPQDPEQVPPAAPAGPQQPPVQPQPAAPQQPYGAPQQPPAPVPPQPQQPYAAPGQPYGSPAQQPYAAPQQPYGAPQYGPPQPQYGGPQQPPYGVPQYGQPYPPAPAKTPILSILALIGGIIGVISLGWGVLFGIAGIVLGFLGKSREPQARGFWLTGLILGFVSVGLIVLWILFIVISAIAAASYDYNY